jgi:hypothetical protein
MNKARNFKEAEVWDIRQHLALSFQERQRIARELKYRFYDRSSPDVRACHKQNYLSTKAFRSSSRNRVP